MQFFCAFFGPIFYKKKIIFFVLRAKVKKIRNLKKVPFFHFPQKVWEGGFTMTPLYNYGVNKLLVLKIRTASYVPITVFHLKFSALSGLHLIIFTLSYACRVCVLLSATPQ